MSYHDVGITSIHLSIITSHFHSLPLITIYGSVDKSESTRKQVEISRKCGIRFSYETLRL